MVKRLTGPDRPTRAFALSGWLAAHKNKLTMDSVQMLQDLLAKPEVASLIPQPKARASRKAPKLPKPAPPLPERLEPSTAPIVPGNFPDTAQLQELMAAYIPTQKTIPISCTAAFSTLVLRLVMAPADNLGSSLVFMALPKLVLSVPPTVTNSRKREQCIKHNIQLATDGQWHLLYQQALALKQASLPSMLMTNMMILMNLLTLIALLDDKQGDSFDKASINNLCKHGRNYIAQE